MGIDRDRIEEVRHAYLAIGNMVELIADAQVKTENYDPLNLTHFAFLLRLVNAELYRVLGEY